MKRIVIISCYPSGQREVEILNRCIEGFRHTGWDIMIVSHLPIDQITAKKVEYTIYDSNNVFLPPVYTPNWWFQTDEYNINIFNGGHTLPICRNMRCGINLAKAMGYEDFIFTECDVLLSKSDAAKLVGLMDNMNSLEKKMLFFRPEEYRDCEGSYVYETVLFGGKIDFFLEVFQPPLDVNEWLRIPMGYTLELSFYEQFSRHEDQYLLVHDHSSNTFTDSDVNVLRYGLFNCELLYNDVVPEEPVLFIMNTLVLEEWKHVDIYKNNELTQTQILGKDHYWFNSYKLDGEEIRVEVYDIDKKYLFLSKKFTLTKENLPLFKERGIIKSK